MAASPKARAYVTNHGGNTVSVIDTDPDSDTYNQVIATVSVGGSPKGWQSTGTTTASTSPTQATTPSGDRHRPGQ